ncbi:MAG: hypothetical protein D8M57_07415 [Candidatus Scalindua sp. AMX11]|nr:MAG: hypothetical protein DWQ00_05665 [Candidatus Scalindua sp.]NOG82486.1 hypothetical protein [Planctomycetota bacterium]RZV93919.1 MAG: hypothetical protein EX341_03425 [Candidatus Scalindua sp. SCAELEC01]TDE65540.1 MAG: hypothetical protein D8M57_07415 [Candidatus Scalindua sp. AMX11]GJQ58122.1 MAG: hypothetical protein SCALA701_09230 [Candidatus Scalindua sp.]
MNKIKTPSNQTMLLPFRLAGIESVGPSLATEPELICEFKKAHYIHELTTDLCRNTHKLAGEGG